MSERPLTDAERSALRRQLTAEQVRVEHRIANLQQTFDELVDAADLEPPDDEHDPDGTTAYERAQVSSLAAEARTRLDQLRTAIDRMEGSGYGSCASCGRPIGVPRLQALPGTTVCVACSGRGPG